MFSWKFQGNMLNAKNRRTDGMNQSFRSSDQSYLNEVQKSPRLWTG